MRSLVSILLFLPAWVFPQDGGLVIDQQTRQPLENARVILPDSNLVHTNSAGIFYMKANQKEGILLVSHLGYVTQEYGFNDPDQILIEMEPDLRELTEVQVSTTQFSEKLKNQTGNMSLLLRENFRFNSQEHISNWLNQVPGIFMHHGTYNTNRLTIRGMGSRDPYGSNRIKAYLNDIPITGGDGETVVEDFSLTGISRIEVLKGPASALYGAGLGGTIRMFTPYPGDKGFGVNTLHQMGSFGLQKHALNAHYKKKRSSLIIDAGRQQSDGFRENSNYYNNHAMLSGEIFVPHIQVGILLHYIDMKAHIPSSLDEETFRNNPGSAAESWKAVEGFEEYRKFLTGISIKNDFSPALRMRTAVFGGGKNLYESRPFNILENKGLRFGLRSILEADFAAFKGILGFELLNENIDWSTFETLQGEKGDLLDAIKENRFYANLFNLYHWNPGERLRLEAGFNLAFTRFRLVESNISGYPSERFWYAPVFSPRLGINYRVNSQLSMFSSVGHGFSTPSFEETLLPDGLRNNQLKPEKGWNLELGARGDFWEKRLHYDITGYVLVVKDLLVTKRISEEVFTGINAGRTVHGGFETYINWTLVSGPRPGTGLHLAHSFQFSGNKFLEFKDDDEDYSGNGLPGIPDYKNDLILRWLTRLKIESSLASRMVGKQYLTDDNSETYGGYQTLDWNISYSHEFSTNFGFSLTLGINNIFNQLYSSMILINAPSFGGVAPRYYYPGMPRNFYIMLTLRFG